MIQSINLYITNLTYIEETKNIDIYKYVVEKYKVGNQSRATVHGRCRISLKPLSYGSLFFQSTIGNLALIHSSSGLKIKRVLDVNLNCIDGGGSLFFIGSIYHFTSQQIAVGANVQYLSSQNNITVILEWSVEVELEQN